MNSTATYSPTYKKRGPAPSPTHPVTALRERAFDVRSERHPARELIQKCTGSYDIKAIVEEDIQTLATMKDTRGLIGFIVTLTGKNGRVLAQGRGNAILNSANRFLQRAVSSAFNSAVADAMLRATRVLDTFRAPSEPDTATVEEAYRVKEEKEESEVSDLATTKQRAYLERLILTGAMAEEERERWLSQMESISKRDASFLIAELAG